MSTRTSWRSWSRPSTCCPRPRRRAATAWSSHEGEHAAGRVRRSLRCDAARLARAAPAAVTCNGRSPRARTSPTYIARRAEALRAIDAVLPDDAARRYSASRGSTTSRYVSISEDTSPVVRLVHSTVYDALRGRRQRHSPGDHAPPDSWCATASTACWRSIATVAGVELAEQVISRIKVMSELDIAERRVPQDGRFKIALEGRADRLSRLDHAQHLRRGRGAAHPRQAGADRQMQRPAPRRARLRRRHRRGSCGACQLAALRHAARHRPDRQRQDHHAVRARSPRPRPATTRSSPSRIRSSTSCPACCRSRSTRRRG